MTFSLICNRESSEYDELMKELDALKSTQRGIADLAAYLRGLKRQYEDCDAVSYMYKVEY